MNEDENDLHLSPLFALIAAVVLLMTVTVLARTNILPGSPGGQPPVFDRLDVSPEIYLVHRLSRSDLFGQPRPRSMPMARPTAHDSESYYLPGTGSSQEFAPARLDGILMDDARFLAKIGRTV